MNGERKAGGMNTPNEERLKNLNGVQCELGDGHPLHFVLNVEKHGRLYFGTLGSGSGSEDEDKKD